MQRLKYCFTQTLMLQRNRWIYMDIVDDPISGFIIKTYFHENIDYVLTIKIKTVIK